MAAVLETPGATAPAERLSPWEVGRARADRQRRLLVAVAVLFAVVSLLFGFPTGREVVTAWVFLLVYVVVGGDGAAWRRAVVHDWLPLTAVLFAYDLLRGAADGLVGRAHVLPQLRVDEALFGGAVPTVWLQQRLYTCIPAWYDYVIVPVYMSHFVVPIAVAVGLWARSYERFQRFAWSLVTLTALTLVTYAVFPAVPPWMASELGVLPPVTRVTPHTVLVSGIPTIHNAVQRGEAYANPVAAIPSLHSAVPLLVLLLAWPYCRRLGRGLLLLYVGAMTFALVYGGEHYVADVLVGWAYAAASVALVAIVARRRSARLAQGAGVARRVPSEQEPR